METKLKPGTGMLLSGLITLVIGLGMTFLLRNAPIGPVAFIVTAVGVGLVLRGIFALTVGDGPGSNMIRWGWILVTIGAVLLILFPLIGIPVAVIGGVAIVGGYVVRGSRQSGAV